MKRSDQKARFIGLLITMITILFLGFLLLVVWSANSGTNPGLLKFGVAFPYSDKVAHFLLIGTASFLLNLSLRNRTLQIFQRNWLMGSLIIFVVISLEEFSQLFIPSRSFDWLDLGANYLGIFAFSLLAKGCMKLVVQ